MVRKTRMVLGEYDIKLKLSTEDSKEKSRKKKITIKKEKYLNCLKEKQKITLKIEILLILQN